MLGILQAAGIPTVKTPQDEVASELLQKAGGILEDFLKNVERDIREYGVGYEFRGPVRLQECG